MLLKLGSKALTESVSLPRARVHILWNESYQVSLAFQKPDCEIKSIPVPEQGMNISLTKDL